ncbi:MAG: hypothetical protein COT17_01010 [Elusimicrobia bacterium CG08_land_8_20_14_0_20_51_18]|nr:MAG: hypothetical protein COT17_01010 [Elusimicrobia bacterium CG08_land_8_20_14_0_20_51_18]
MKKFFTTSEAAEMCGVAHTTVIRWITEGRLKAHETPGGHRRIGESELVSFLKQFNIPVPASLGDGRCRILAVDDDKGVLKLLRRVFYAYSKEMELETTGNGMEALVMLGRKRFDILILDVAMPGMDGIKVCETIKKNPELSALKIIVITGRQFSEKEEEYLKNNSEAFIRKPLQPSILLARVQALIKNK